MNYKKPTKKLNIKKKYIKTERKITIDKLAVMTQNGFGEIENKFIEIDNRFIEIDNRFIEIDNRFIEIEKQIEKIDQKLDEKFDKVLIGQDKLIGLLDTQRTEDTMHDGLHQEIGDTLVNHAKRIKKVENKIGVN